MATRCHSLTFIVTRCHSLYHSLSLVVPLAVIRCLSLSFVVTRCTTRCHLLSLVVTRCTIRLSFYKRSLECVTILGDKIITNKTLEHASLIFTEPWALANEIMLTIMQNFKFDFLENEFWTDWGVRFKIYFQNLI